MKLSPMHSLKISLMPAFFAAGCCAITPLISFFGFSYAEYILTNYVWEIRAGGVLFLVLAIAWYFYKEGVTSASAIRENKLVIIITTIQTVVISLAIYGFFVYIITPIVAENVDYQMAECCTF